MSAIFKVERDDGGHFMIQGQQSAARLFMIIQEQDTQPTQVIAFCHERPWAERIKSLLEEHYK